LKIGIAGDVIKKISESQPAATSHAKALGQIESNTQQIENAVKANQDLLKGVGRNNDC
jgi:hypothetical protein